MRRKMLRSLMMGLFFISPWVIGFLVFTLYPLTNSLYHSFTEYNVFRSRWIGLSNYREMLRNETLGTALYNTTYLVVLYVPLMLVFGFITALILNMGAKGVRIYRTIYYLPTMVPPVAAAVLWQWILNPQFGIANAILRLLHLPEIGWLTSPVWSKPSMILLMLWGIGGSTILYLAGLQDIPQVLYEAAELDGAGWWKKIWHVTVPMVSRVTLFNLIMGVIGGFQTFTEAWVMASGAGGETAFGWPRQSLLFYTIYLYAQAFFYGRMGYASAMAWVLFLIILTLTLILLRTSKRWVFSWR